MHFPCHLWVRFPTRNPKEHLQADAMVNSGNRMPGSAVISVMFMDAMGIQDLLLPTDTRILTASEDRQPLQVIGVTSTWPSPTPQARPRGSPWPNALRYPLGVSRWCPYDYKNNPKPALSMCSPRSRDFGSIW